MAAITHEMTMISSGVGSAASATIGARMVTARAVTLHVPNTLPIYRLSKNYRVLMYKAANAPPVPNLAAMTEKGTTLSHENAAQIQRTVAAAAAMAFVPVSTCIEPIFKTNHPAA